MSRPADSGFAVAVNPVMEHPGVLRPSRADRADAYGSAVGDAVDGAFAVVAVTAVLVRYAAEAAAAGRRSALARLPFTRQGPVLRRALHGPVARLLAHPASAAVRAVSLAADRVDVDRVFARTDLAGFARYVVEEIDLPGLLRASTGSVTTGSGT